MASRLQVIVRSAGMIAAMNMSKMKVFATMQ
jgi:hypothetical protein